MAYITYQQYVDMYGAPPVTEEEFPIYATSASDVIDAITEYRIIKAGGLTTFPQLIQDLVPKAVGAEVLYLIQNGLETVLTGQTGAGFTVGKVHVDGGNASGMTQAQLITSPLAKMYLEQTGLMGRRVTCLDPYHSSYLGIW